jgi:hypothetical protein
MLSPPPPIPATDVWLLVRPTPELRRDRKLELREFPDPTPGPRDVILEIKASRQVNAGRLVDLFETGAGRVRRVRGDGGPRKLFAAPQESACGT